MEHTMHFDSLEVVISVQLSACTLSRSANLKCFLTDFDPPITHRIMSLRCVFFQGSYGFTFS